MRVFPAGLYPLLSFWGGEKKAKGGKTVCSSNKREGVRFITVVILSDGHCSRRGWAAWKEATVLKKGHS